jgi:hypothetical protein
VDFEANSVHRLLQGRLIFSPLSLEATPVGDRFSNWLIKMPSAPSLFPSVRPSILTLLKTMKLTKVFRVTLTRVAGLHA